MNSKTPQSLPADGLDWAENLRGLRRSVSSSPGAQVLICLYDSAKSLQSALEDIKTIADGLKLPFSRFEITDDGIGTPQALLNAFENTPPDKRGVAAVTGVYAWLRGTEQSYLNLRQLNIYRDLLLGFNPPIQVLLMIPEPLGGTFAVDCPDLYAYRSGLFQFHSSPQERETMTAEFSRRPEWQDTMTREQKLHRIKHIDEALENTVYETPLEKQLLVDILSEKGSLEQEIGQYPQALETLDKALGIAVENRLLQQQANVLNIEGLTLKNTGNYRGAIDKFERSSAIINKIYGEDHPNVAAVLNNLGSALKDLGNLNGAKDNFEKSLKIGLANFGENHPIIASCLNNLGSVLKDLGNLNGAKDNFEKALKIDIANFGENHPNVANRLNNLGSVLQDLGDLNAAKDNYEKALKIAIDMFGESHPNVAVCLNNLGLVQQHLGDLKAAKDNYEKALKIVITNFGENHPSVATHLNNLSSVLQDLGDLNAAKDNYEKALKIDIVNFGENHPNVAIRLNNLGLVLYRFGDMNGAKDNFEKALKINVGNFGENHHHVVKNLINFGTVLIDNGDLNSARIHLEKALKISSEINGNDHPETTTIRMNLKRIDKGNAVRDLKTK